MSTRGRPWVGTATDLLVTLGEQVEVNTRRTAGWPKSPRTLTGALRRGRAPGGGNRGRVRPGQPRLDHYHHAGSTPGVSPLPSSRPSPRPSLCMCLARNALRRNVTVVDGGDDRFPFAQPKAPKGNSRSGMQGLKAPGKDSTSMDQPLLERGEFYRHLRHWRPSFVRSLYQAKNYIMTIGSCRPSPDRHRSSQAPRPTRAGHRSSKEIATWDTSTT